MAKNNPRGLVPTRHLSGGQSFRTQLRKTGGRNASPIRIGDPVYLDATGDIQRALVATAAGQPWLGVVTDVYDSNKRPMTHRLPANPRQIDASTAGFALVCEDPDIVFTIHCTASIGPSNVGMFANVAYMATGTAAGISGAVLDGVDVTSTSVGHPLKIIGVAATEGPESPGVGATNNDIEVVISQHLWRNPIRRNVVQV